MNQRGVLIAVSICVAALLFYFGGDLLQGPGENVSGQEEVASIAGLDSRGEIFGESTDDLSNAAGAGSNSSVLGSGGKEPDFGPERTRNLGPENVRTLQRCFEPAESGLSLKSGDGLNEVLNSILSVEPLDRFVETENLHFKDQSGEPLRFQILGENESRFFRVDKEGLPIRIDPPAEFAGLNPSAQKDALRNVYKTPVFSESFERYSTDSTGDEKPGFSVQIRRLNGVIAELQAFYKDPSRGILRSAGCSVDLNLRCRCL